MEELLHFFNENKCIEGIPGIYDCSGFCDSLYLKILSTSILSRENIGDGKIYETKWDLIANTQELHEMDENGFNVENENMELIIVNDIIDLNDGGRRWEGNSGNGVPFGFGCLYDENGNKRYLGFQLVTIKTCFGVEFYEDGKTVAFCGTFLHGQHHGYGILYDKKENELYRGYFHNGSVSFETNLVIQNMIESDELIHSLLHHISIGNHCYACIEQLSFDSYPLLKSILIGSHSFSNTYCFSIVDCHSLESVSVGSYSFSNNEINSNFSFYVNTTNSSPSLSDNSTNSISSSIIIDSCNSLHCLKFESNSFRNMKEGCTISSILCFLLFIRSSFSSKPLI